MMEILSVIFIFFGLSFLIIIHELGHFLAAKRFGLWVEEFGFGLPPRLWGRKIGDTLYSLNWLPFGGFVKIYGERHLEESPDVETSKSFSRQTIGKRALIIAAGVLMNFLLGWLLISSVFLVGIPQGLLVTEVRTGSLAEAVGIQKGDRLLDFKTVPELLDFIEKNKGREINLLVQRAGEKLSLSVTPRILAPDGEGNLGIFIVESGLPKLGILSSFWEGLKTAIKISAAIFLGILDLIIGVFTDINVLERFVGPVGIVSVAIETTKLGLAPFIQLLAMISLNLAVFNVFPIPVLDGGRLFFLAVEKFRGRPFNPKTEMAANAISFAFLLFLILAITAKDILAFL